MLGKDKRLKDSPKLLETAQDLVRDVSGLASLPEVCSKVSELVGDPNASASQLGRVISQDAALTARLLRIVNSAFYRFPARIDTISRAVTIIGQRDLKEIVLAASVSGIFERMESHLIDIDYFWRHAVYTGIVARIVAKQASVLHSERLFIAGLLHDIGRLVLCYKKEADMKQAIDLSLTQDIPLFHAEEMVFGFSHADVGAELMNKWDLPESLQYTTRWHHTPVFTEYALDCAVVYLADVISHMAERGEYPEEDIKRIPDMVWRLTGLQHSDVETLTVSARAQFIESLHLFRPGSRVTDTHIA